ncbi:MAG TPA: SDR family NAD(P)-dependent oxidoreductase [Myxococcota bacterium]|nr:SDR family NAD(P)-dependent oxidoreductase [Myxococcota bacterium]
MENLSGRVAVVTGGASGIGAGIARACAEQGMRVVLADVEIAPAERLARELVAGGNQAFAVRTDVTAPGEFETLADAAFERFGAADVLFNNAGVAQGGPVHEFTNADWEWLLGVNLYGVVNGCRAFVPRWIARGATAHVVNTASVGGFLSGPVLGMYSTTKFAVVAYSESLAQEVAGRGIGVSVLCPGWTNTNLGDASRNRPAALGTAPDQLDIITPGMAEGMDPIDVGRHAVRGVRENAMYVFTHPEFQPLIADRFAKVIAAIERAKEPVKLG